MKLGLIISVMLHVALLAWALVSISAPRTPDIPETIPVAVDLVTPSDLDRMRQGSEQAKLMQAVPKEVPQPEGTPKEVPPPPKVVMPPPPPPPPAAASEPPPPPPEPAKAEPPPKSAPDPIAEKLAAATPPPEPGPSPEEVKLKDEQRRAEQEAERKAQEDVKRKAEADAKRKADEDAKKAEDDRKKAIARKKADDDRKKKLADEKRKKEFNDVARRLQALEDKTPAKDVAAASAPSTETKLKGPVLGSPKGADTQLSATERSILLGKIVGKVKECWNINAGMEGAGSLVPVVTFELNRDGSVRGQPRVTNAQSSPQFRDAADSAVRAIMQCQNYDLPPDKYEAWEIITLKFDPSQMFR